MYIYIYIYQSGHDSTGFDSILKKPFLKQKIDSDSTASGSVRIDSGPAVAPFCSIWFEITDGFASIRFKLTDRFGSIQ